MLDTTLLNAASGIKVFCIICLLCAGDMPDYQSQHEYVDQAFASNKLVPKFEFFSINICNNL